MSTVSDKISLNFTELQEYLRMTPPLIFIDEAFDIVPGQAAKARKKLTDKEPYFPFHFPGNPMVPGFVQMESMLQTAALAIHTLPGNKEKSSYVARVHDMSFFAPICPGDTMEIETIVESWKRGVGKFHGTIKVREKIVCKSEFNLVIESDMLQK